MSSDPTDPPRAEAQGFELPPLNEAILDRPTLEQLFLDIGAHTQLLDVAIKGGAREHAREVSPDLHTARQLLIDGAVRALQLRYRYDGKEWWDTLIVTPEGVKLVRIGHDWESQP